MTGRAKRFLVAVGALVGTVLILCVTGVSSFLYTVLSPQEREVWSFERADAIECTCQWARTAPLPEAAHLVSVTTGGSIFTREFHVTFAASAGEVAEWLRRSPGARDAVATTKGTGIRHFQVAPGGGAAFAEITVDDAQRLVVIRDYWS